MTFVKTYKTLPITVVRGEDCYVWDADGKRYLDMYGGHAVVSTGHSHPHVVKAITEQARDLVFYSTFIDLEIRRVAAEKLVSVAPPELTSVLFANSGAEANENALKMAVMQTGRKKLVTFQGGWHGRTLLALNVTTGEKYRKQRPYQIPDIVECPFDDLAALDEYIDESTAAVILEPIQSMAGCRMGSPEFYQKLRARTKEVGAYLIYDEVQTGIGRTGTMFFSGRFDVVPDIATLAKGIASGVPLSAVLVTQALADKVQYGEFGATYGAGPLAMAAMKATIEVIENEGLLDRVTEVSSFLHESLKAVPGVVGIRGLGHLTGIELDVPAGPVQGKLLENRIITGTSEDPNVLRLLPPLTLTKAHAEEFLAGFAQVLAEVRSNSFAQSA